MSLPPNTPLRERESTGLNRARVELELRRSVRPLVVFGGLIALAVACGALLLKNMAAQTPFGDYYRVQVAVDDAKGVVPGHQEVRLAGVQVGQIKSVALARGRPVLTISIERRYAPLYRDARLRLRPATPLDDLYLDIEDRGHRRAGAIRDGGSLGSERTHVPVNVSRVLNVFDAPTRDRFNAMIDEFGRALSDNGDQLRATLAELTPFLRAAQRLTRETAIRRGRTRRLVRNFRLVMDELARRDRQLTGLIAAGDTTFGALASTSGPLGRTLDELEPMVAQLRDTSRRLDTAFGALDPALTALQPTARALGPGLNALRALSRAGAPAFRSLRAATRRLVPLTEQARPLSAQLGTAFSRMRPSAPRLDRTTQAIVPCELFVQKFFAWTASVVKFRDALAAYPRGEGVPGQQLYVNGRSCAGEGPPR